MKAKIKAVAGTMAIGIVVLASAQPAAAARPTGLLGSLTAAECSRTKGEIGKKAFRKRFGTRRAMTRCMSQGVPAARQAIAVATAACQEELNEFGEEEFFAEWSSFEECVAVYADWELDSGLEDDTEGEEE